MCSDKPIRGRPKIYTKEQIKQHRTLYMLSKPWYCDSCNKTYSLAYKTLHLRTRKHLINLKNLGVFNKKNLNI